MLYTDALTEVRARLQELSADFWLDAELYRAINEGILRFSQEEKWPYLYTLAEGITLPAAQETLELQPGVAYERHFDLAVSFSGDGRIRLPARVHPAEGYRLRKTWYNTASEPVAYYITNTLAAGQDEVQSLANAGTTVGTFTLTFDGEATDAISRGATAAVIEAALKDNANIGTADVECWGGPLGTATVYIRFVNNLGGVDQSTMVLGGTTASLTIAEVTAGGTPSGAYTTVIRFVPAMTREATIEYQYIRTPVLETSSFAGVQIDVPEEYAMGVCAYATGHAFLKELNYSQKADEQFALYRKAVDDATRNSRKFTSDSGFAWGKTQPQFGFVDDDIYTELVTPPTLGP